MAARPGSDFCRVHSGKESFFSREVLHAIGGAIVGNALFPGLGGIIVGGISGVAVSELAEGAKMKKKRVFVSFDFDNDRKLKDFIIGQSRSQDSPFEIIDHSLKEAAPERDWESTAEAAIRRSDIVLVMVGPKTYRAAGVLKEVQMARRNSIPIVQVIGYRDGDYTPVRDAGRLYLWNWDNLKKLLG